MGMLFKGQGNPGQANKLNQNQRIAMSDGNLNQAIAARMNKGGIIGKVK